MDPSRRPGRGRGRSLGETDAGRRMGQRAIMRRAARRRGDRPTRRSSSCVVVARASASMRVAMSRTIEGWRVSCACSSGFCRSSLSFSPGRTPVNRMGISVPTWWPDRRTIRSASSRMLTGSPMSSMKISPPSGERRRLQHELHRLADAHEEPGHAGVGDRDRAALGDLAGEGGDHAAPAAEDVAEPHRAPARADGRQRAAPAARRATSSSPARSTGARPCRSR